MVTGGWRRLALLAAVVLVGLGATAGSTYALAGAQRSHDTQLLAQRAEIVQQAVGSEVGRYVEALNDLAVAVGTQETLTAQAFRALVATLTSQRLPGSTGVSFVVPASDPLIGTTQELWRGRGSTNLTLTSAGAGLIHRFVVFSVRLDGTTPTTGADLAGVPQAADVLDTASASDRVAASVPYVLARDRTLPAARQQRSLLLGAVVHAGGVDAGAVEGWLILGLRTGDFLTGVLRLVAQDTVDVDLHDPAVQGPLAQWWTGPSDARVAPQEVGLLLAERRWSLVVAPRPALFGATDSSAMAIIWGAGLVATLLLAALVLALSASRDRALRAVARATAALRQDIQRRERTEAQLRHREAELEGFAAVAAHDLRAPLANLTGHAELLADELPAGVPEDARQSITAIQAGARRMAVLIDDLLTYASAERQMLRLAPTDLGAIVGDVLAERVPTIRPRPWVQVGILPVVTADPGLIRQVMDNLIGNALKYTPPGRPAEVEIVATHLDGDLWRVEVADRGIGIPAEQRVTVFNAFRRGRGAERYPGTGLGLAICQRIVERHGGRIGADANDGGGTRFWIVLPSRPAVDETGRGSDEQPPRDATPGRTALAG